MIDEDKRNEYFRQALPAAAKPGTSTFGPLTAAIVASVLAAFLGYEIVAIGVAALGIFVAYFFYLKTREVRRYTEPILAEIYQVRQGDIPPQPQWVFQDGQVAPSTVSVPIYSVLNPEALCIGVQAALNLASGRHTYSTDFKIVGETLTIAINQS